MIDPHGGRLINRFLTDEERREWLSRSKELPHISVSLADLQELENIATGLFSPLKGFMRREDYKRVVDEMRLADGTVWTIPIVLPIKEETARCLKIGEYAVITDENGREFAIIQVQDIFERDVNHEAKEVYKTTDENHPGVARLYKQSKTLIGGEIWMLRRIEHKNFNQYRFDPSDTRRMFAERGWKSVVAFQTRNPIHRAHEYLQKVALEIVDGLFLNPLVGETKSDDIPAHVRMRCYEAVLERYYPKDRVIMGVFPVNMRYAGPREAIFHAICRKNYGCTHIIIGRDHAGVGNYYSPYEAQEIFDQFDPDEIGITPLKFEHAFYCRRCGGMATRKTCPHPKKEHILLSGTKMRELLRRGIYPPPEFTRPEVAQILMEAVRRDRGAVMKRLAIIGLDCADPKLIFEEMIDDLPSIKSLMRNSTYGRLKSIIPPITVPAWMCMMTGKDPGELGIYGFRNRKDYSYDSLFLANSNLIRYPKVWDRLGLKGLRSILIGIPLTYPPKRVKGYLISGFLAPDTQSDYTYPRGLKDEIRAWVGEYMLDVPDFRTEEKERILRDIYRMTEKRFELAKRLISEKDWDFFMMVEMGLDRIYHGFWAYHDVTHPKHDPNSPYKDVIKEYTAYLDEKIGEILRILPDGTDLVIVSDHGVQGMHGGINLNEWLIQKGYLKLKEYPETPIRMEDLIRNGLVDWSKTIAWSEGGYDGKVFLNVEGREPNGVVPQWEYETVRTKLKEEIEGITDEHGNPLGTIVYRPEEVYRSVRNISPDLIVYFGNLTWRALGTVGSGRIWSHENDIGPDDANHAQYGLWLMTGGKDERKEMDILEIHDLVMRYYF